MAMMFSFSLALPQSLCLSFRPYFPIDVCSCGLEWLTETFMAGICRLVAQ